MSYLNLILPFIKKFKYFALVLIVAVITYLVVRRWGGDTLRPIWYICVAVTVTATLLIIFLTIFLKKRKEKKMAAALEAGISQADEDKVDLKGEIKALRENWTNSLSMLKTSRVGGGTGAALAQMPWYVIIGEPASGKTTLLLKSGLEFPIGDTTRGLHGTRNCDWLFANEAIFLDTAGRYTVETQEPEWLAFLDLLKKYRSKKPINGLMVALPANSLLTKSHDERVMDGKRIRSRIDELIEHLGVNFPVYVLVTKCDLVGGFVEFFGSLDRRPAEQMLGWTNPADGDFKFDRETYEKKFDETTEQVFRMRPWLESSTKKRDLMKAFMFPEEFSYLREPLGEVIDIVFRPNIYQETPVCRGIYFSSGTQVGNPLAKALEDMAKDLNIPADFGFGIGMDEEKELRTYFIRDLVAEQILKDKEMSFRTWRAEAKARKKQAGWGMIGVAVAAILALFSINAFRMNTNRHSQFAGAIEEKDRPLEAAIGCLDTHENVSGASFLDFGLNYSDQLRPMMMKTFRSVFARGCIEPLLKDLKGLADQKVEKTEAGTLDVDSYIDNYEHYTFLKRELPEEPDVKSEQRHLDWLFRQLKAKGGTGAADREDLRRALRTYGPITADDEFAVLRQEIDAAFLKRLDPVLVDIETWLAENQEDSLNDQKKTDKGITNLQEECRKNIGKIVPHKKVDDILRIAEQIKLRASPHQTQVEGSVDLLTATGVSEMSDLKHMLQRIRAAAPLPDDVLPEAKPDRGWFQDRIDKLVFRAEDKDTEAKTRERENARLGIVGFLNRLIQENETDFVYSEEPSEESLTARRDDIKRALADVEARAWKDLRPHIETIEGGPVETEEVEEGETVKKRKDGWWEVLILLARARATDLAMEQYLSEGMMEFLDSEDWMRERSRDREEDMFNVQRMEDIIHARLNQQNEFFNSMETVADELRDDATTEAAKANARYLELLRKYWLGEFRRAIPESAPQNIGTAYDQLRFWEDERSQLSRARARIEDALWDITDFGDDEESPLLEATFEDRRRIFDTFVLCFSRDVEKVRAHATIVNAARVFEPVRQDLDGVARGFAGGEAASLTLKKILSGADPSFTKAEDEVEQFVRDGTMSEPSKLIGDWMSAVFRVCWSELIDKTAKHINDSWLRRKEDWAGQLSGGDAKAFQDVFGGRASDLWKFERDFIEPFFGTGTTLRVSGKATTMELVGDFAGFKRQVAQIKNDLLSGGGGIRSDRVKVDLRIEGKDPVGLVVEYRSSSKTSTSDEKRTDRVPVSFEFSWSPATCEEFRIIVGYRNDPQGHVLSWSGDWAVAKAFAEAEKGSGGDYVWRGNAENKGEYEVHLTVEGGDLGTLFDLYREYKGANPLIGIVSKLPEKIIRVVRR